ncbi:MAG: hypothetical protein V1851_01045 [Patescibacteria group bacterium]
MEIRNIEDFLCFLNGEESLVGFLFSQGFTNTIGKKERTSWHNLGPEGVTEVPRLKPLGINHHHGIICVTDAKGEPWCQFSQNLSREKFQKIETTLKEKFSVSRENGSYVPFSQDPESLRIWY